MPITASARAASSIEPADEGPATAAPTFPGSQLWVAREESPGSFFQAPKAVGVSADGTKVFVTGQYAQFGGNFYGTFAYDAATGKRLWFQFYPRVTAHPDDHANALVVSPDGTRVFVTGESLGPGTCPVEGASSSGGPG